MIEENDTIEMVHLVTESPRQQVLAFARDASERHRLPRSRQTPCAVITRWLKPRTGRG